MNNVTKASACVQYGPERRSWPTLGEWTWFARKSEKRKYEYNIKKKKTYRDSKTAYRGGCPRANEIRFPYIVTIPIYLNFKVCVWQNEIIIIFVDIDKEQFWNLFSRWYREITILIKYTKYVYRPSVLTYFSLNYFDDFKNFSVLFFFSKCSWKYFFFWD